MESVWLQQEEAGADLVLTSGELFTDPAMHGPSKIAGETRFVLDLRSLSDATMEAVAAEARAAAVRIGDGLPRALRSRRDQRFARRGDGRAAARASS